MPEAVVTQTEGHSRSRIYPQKDGPAAFECTDKFGNHIHTEPLNPPYHHKKAQAHALIKFPDLPAYELFPWAWTNLLNWDYSEVLGFLKALIHSSDTDQNRKRSLEVLSKLIGSRRYPTGKMRRSSLLSLYSKCFQELVANISAHPTSTYSYLDVHGERPDPQNDQQILIINADGFPSEGERSLSLEIVNMYKRGFKLFMIVNCKGQRFIANGLGPNTRGVQIDVYGSAGDYLGSGIDGADVIMHGNARISYLRS